ncbi:MAG TPA: pseudomurein-binding repeat-containing protein, partial [Methanobacterium sp.]
INKNNKKPISVTAVGKAPYPRGIYTTGELYNYLSIAKKIQTFINKKKRAPNYAQTTLGKISFSKLVYMYSKVINFYGKQKRLPKYVATYKI